MVRGLLPIIYTKTTSLPCGSIHNLVRYVFCIGNTNLSAARFTQWIK